jgi:hypothetical protein
MGSEFSTLFTSARGQPSGYLPWVLRLFLLMDSNTNTKQNWNILNWNVRGLNSDDKRNTIREKLEESAYSIFCLQETKSWHFDHSSIRKMTSKKFNKFDFVSSQGA